MNKKNGFNCGTASALATIMLAVVLYMGAASAATYCEPPPECIIDATSVQDIGGSIRVSYTTSSCNLVMADLLFARTNVQLIKPGTGKSPTTHPKMLAKSATCTSGAFLAFGTCFVDYPKAELDIDVQGVYGVFVRTSSTKIDECRDYNDEPNPVSTHYESELTVNGVFTHIADASTLVKPQPLAANDLTITLFNAPSVSIPVGSSGYSKVVDWRVKNSMGVLFTNGSATVPVATGSVSLAPAPVTVLVSGKYTVEYSLKSAGYELSTHTQSIDVCAHPTLANLGFDVIPGTHSPFVARYGVTAHGCNETPSYQLIIRQGSSVLSDTGWVATAAGNATIAATFPPVTEGAYTATFRYRNASGLIVERVDPFSVTCAKTWSSSPSVASQTGVTGSIAGGMACHGTGTITANVQRAGVAVGSGATSFNYATGGTYSVPYALTLPANDRYGTYQAVVKATDAKGQAETDTIEFSVACPAPTSSVASTAVNPDSDDPMSITFNHSSKDICNGAGTAQLLVLDGGTTVINQSKTSIAAGADSSLKYSFAALAPNKTYTARLKLTNAFGHSVTSDYPLTVAPCSNAWAIGVVNAESTGVTSTVTSATKCASPATIKSTVVKSGVQVASATGASAIVPSPAAVAQSYSLTNPLNQRAGTYTTTLSVTDKQGRTKSKSDDFAIACPAPEISLGTLKLNPITDNPFEVSYGHDSPDICSGAGSATLTVKQGESVVATGSVGSIPAGTVTSPKFSFSPLEPGQTYRFEFRETNVAGQSVARDDDITIACLSGWSIGDASATSTGVSGQINGLFGCNGPVTVTAVVKDAGGVVVGGNTALVSIGETSGTYVLGYAVEKPVNQRAGNYSVELTVKDVAGVIKTTTLSFTIPCSPITAGYVSGHYDLGVDNPFVLNYSVSSPDVCSGPIVGELLIKHDGTTVRSVPVGPLNAGVTSSIGVPFEPLEGGKTYTSQLQVTSQSGSTHTVSKSIVVACKSLWGIEEVAAGQSGLSATIFGAYTCNGPLITQALVRKAGLVVADISHSAAVVGQPTVDTLAYTLGVAPSELSGVYDVEYMIRDQQGVTRSKTTSFAVACPTHVVSMTGSDHDVVANDPFAIRYTYASTDICNGLATATLKIKDGGSVIRSAVKSGLLAAASTPVSFEYQPLQPGKIYVAELTTVDTAGKVTVTLSNIAVSCPDIWKLKALAADENDFTGVIEDVYQCSSNIDITGEVTKGGDVVAALTQSVTTATGDVPFGKAYALSVAPNARAGDYELKIHAEDALGRVRDAALEFSIACPVPSAGLIDKQVNPDADDPFKLDYLHYSSDVCNGVGSARLRILHGPAVQFEQLIGGVAAGTQTPLSFSFPPLTPGLTYTAELQIVNGAGQQVTRLDALEIGCSDAWTLDAPVGTQSGVHGSVTNAYTCASPFSVTTTIKKSGTTVGGGGGVVELTGNPTPYAIPHSLTVPTNELAGSYDINVVATDKNGVSKSRTGSFSVACPMQSAVYVGGEYDLSGDANFSSRFAVNSTDVCTGASNATLTVRENGIAIRSVNKSMTGGTGTFEHDFSFAALEGGKTYELELKIVDALDRLVVATSTVTVSCVSVWTFDSLSAYEGVAEGSVSSSLTCNGPGDIELTVRRDGDTVVDASNVQVFENGVTSIAVPYSLAVPTNNRAGTYEATARVTDAQGAIKERTAVFSVSCPMPAVTALADNVQFGVNEPFSLDYLASSPDICHQSLSATLLIKNGQGETIRTVSKSGMPTGTSSVHGFEFAPVEPGQSYTAEVTLSTGSGHTVTEQHEFHVGCPSAWELGDIQGTLETVSASADGLKQCNLPLRAKFTVSKVGVQAGSATGYIHAVEEALDASYTTAIPANQRAGEYVVTVEAIDAMGTKKTFVDSFVVACPVPSQMLVGSAISVGADNPFSLRYEVAGQDVCNDPMTQTIRIFDNGILLRNISSAVDADGGDALVSHTFEPLIGGKSYVAEATLGAPNGASVTLTNDLMVECGANWSLKTMDANQSEATLILQGLAACNMPATVSYVVRDEANQTVGSSSTNLPNVTTSHTQSYALKLPPGEAAGQYTVTATVRDKLGVEASTTSTFLIACPLPSLDFKSATVDPGTDIEFSLLYRHRSADACGGTGHGSLKIATLDGTTVRTATIENIKAGKDSNVAFGFSPLPPGAGYLAIASIENESGQKIERSDVIAVPCTSWWSFGSVSASTSPLQVSGMLDGRLSCNGPIDVTARVVDSKGKTVYQNQATVGSGSGSAPFLVDLAGAADFLTGGSYIVEITAQEKDGQLRKTSVLLAFPCETPTLSIVAAVQDAAEPNAATIQALYSSNAACTGKAGLQLSVADGSGKVVAATSVNGLEASKVSNLTLPLAGIEPGASYTVKAVATTQAGQSVVATGALAMSCPSLWSFTVTEAENLKFGVKLVSDKAYKCNEPATVSTAYKKAGTVVATQLEPIQLAMAESGVIVGSSPGIGGATSAGSYVVEVTVVDSNSVSKTGSTTLEVPCPAPTMSLNATATKPGVDSPFKYTYEIASGDVCNGPMSAGVKLLRDGLVVATANASEIPGGIKSMVEFNTATLDVGVYTAIANLTPAAGGEVTSTNSIVVGCPDSWGVNDVVAIGSTGQVRGEMVGGYACHGPATAKLSVVDPTLAVVATGEAAFATTTMPAKFAVPFDLLDSVPNGTPLTANITITDSQGVSRSATRHFTAACPTPFIELQSVEATPDEHDPFTATYKVTQAGVCSGVGTLLLEVLNASGVVVGTAAKGGIPGGASTVASLEFAPLQPGAYYTLRATLANVTGQKAVTKEGLLVACPAPTVAEVSVLDGVVQATLSGYACNVPASANFTATQDGLLAAESQSKVSKFGSFTMPVTYITGSQNVGGDYQGLLKIVGAGGATVEAVIPFHVNCALPLLSDLMYQNTIAGAGVWELGLNYSSSVKCNDLADLTLAVRDPGNVVVATATVNGLPAAATTPVTFDFEGQGGGDYIADITGATAHGEHFGVSLPFNVSCGKPTVLRHGQDATGTRYIVAALLDECDDTATSTVRLSRDDTETSITRTAPLLSPAESAGRLRVATVDIADLADGLYKAEVTISPRSNSPVFASGHATVELDGPVATFFEGGNKISGNSTSVNALNDLAIEHIDENGLPVAATAVGPAPSGTDGVVAVINAIDGGAVDVNISTGQGGAVVIDGQLVDGDTYLPLDNVQVLFKHLPSGVGYAMPAVRYGLTSSLVGQLEDVANWWFAQEALAGGFRAVASVHGLPAGNYSIQGVSGTRNGQHIFANASGTFQIDAALPNGRPVLTSDDGSATLNFLSVEGVRWPVQSTAVTTNGSYALGISTADALGNRGKPQHLIFKYERKVVRKSVWLPRVEVFPEQAVEFTLPTHGALPLPELLTAEVKVNAVGEVRLNGEQLAQGTQSVQISKASSSTYRFTVSSDDSGASGEVKLSFIHPDAPELVLSLRPVGGPISVQGDKSGYVVLAPAVFGYSATVEAGCKKIVNFDIAKLGDVTEPLCAVKFASLPAGLAVDPSSHKVKGAFELIGLHKLTYQTGIVFTHEGVSKFYPMATKELPVNVKPPSQLAVAFVPGSSYRSDDGLLYTGVGKAAPGMIEVIGDSPGLQLQWSVNGEDFVASTTGSKLGTYIQTELTEAWQKATVSVKASYTKYPGLMQEAVFELIAKPEAPSVILKALPGWVSTESALVEGSIGRMQNGAHVFDSTKYGNWKVALYQVLGNGSLAVIGTEKPVPESGAFSWTLTNPPVGKSYIAIMAVAEAQPDGGVIATQKVRSGKLYVPVKSGAPVEISVASRTKTGAVPLSSLVTANAKNTAEVTSVSKLLWETSPDGIEWSPVTGEKANGWSQLVQLSSSGQRYVRATSVNRYSGMTFTSSPILLEAYLVPKLKIVGDFGTFVATPAKLSVAVTNGVVADITWRAKHSVTEQVIEGTGPDVTLPADSIGVWYLTASASEVGAPETVAALSKASASVRVTAPMLRTPVVVGPRAVESGVSYEFSLLAYDIFPGGVDSSLTVEGNWILPSGEVIASAAPVQYTVTPADVASGKVTVRYEQWVVGYEASTKRLGSLVARPWTYSFPSFTVSVSQNGTESPSTVTMRAVGDISTMGGARPTYSWSLPDESNLLYSNNGAVLLSMTSPGTYGASLTVSDDRGNVQHIPVSGIVVTPPKPLHFSMAVTSNNIWNRAPASLLARLKVNSIARYDSIANIKYYMNGVEVLDGRSLSATLSTSVAGEHTILARATTAFGSTTEKAVSIVLTENSAPTCSVTPLGDFTVSRTLTANCSDVDGYVASLRWHVNGVDVQATGTRISLTTEQMQGLIGVSLTAKDQFGKTTVVDWSP